MTALNPEFATGHSHDPRQRVWNWNDVTPEDHILLCGDVRLMGVPNFFCAAQNYRIPFMSRNWYAHRQASRPEPPATCNKLLPSGVGVIHGAMLNLFCNHLPIRSLMQ